MESDVGKLFIGGISWDTNENSLREYFNNFGEVVETFIMKDRTTGRARGFGFVIFADPAVAERVLMEKHLIDGRMVEAKKAVPRDDQHMLNRNNNSIHGSPGPGGTKKIFVGGLASTVTDADFKKYFEQFGTINDVVVMYDHNTQRPRGFGFITFNSEEAVDKVLHKTFHELNGKMVEVKIAVPKELSPKINMRSPTGGLNYGLNRMNNFFNGYNPSSLGSYFTRMDSRFGPLEGARKVFPSFSPGYNIELNTEPGMNPTYGGSPNFNSDNGYGKVLSPYFNGNSSRFGGPIGYGGGNGIPGSTFSSAPRSLWNNNGFNNSTNPTSSNSFLTSGRESLNGFGDNGLKWGGSSFPLLANNVRSGLGFSMNPNYGTGENSFGLVAGRNERSNGLGPIATSLATTINGYEGDYTNSFGGSLTYEGSSIYGDPTWQSASSELDDSSPFGFGMNATSDVISKGGSPINMGGYAVSNMHIDRGVAA